MGGNPKGRSARCQRDSNILHDSVVPPACRSLTWPFSTPKGRRGNDAGFWLNGCSAPAFARVNPSRTLSKEFGGGLRARWLLYPVGSTDSRRLLAAPCGTLRSWGASLPGTSRGSGRLCPRRAEAARAACVPGYVRDKQTRQKESVASAIVTSSKLTQPEKSCVQPCYHPPLDQSTA